MQGRHLLAVCMLLATDGSSSKPSSPRWYCNKNNKDNLIIPQGISHKFYMQDVLSSSALIRLFCQEKCSEETRNFQHFYAFF